MRTFFIVSRLCQITREICRFFLQRKKNVEKEFLSIKITIFVPFDTISGNEKLFFDILLFLILKMIVNDKRRYLKEMRIRRPHKKSSLELSNLMIIFSY